jgi:hypothetical protein
VSEQPPPIVPDPWPQPKADSGNVYRYELFIQDETWIRPLEQAEWMRVPPDEAARLSYALGLAAGAACRERGRL